MGRFESYHWATTPNNEGPIGFSYGWRACAKHDSGPFNFAKGALFFVSANLSRAVTDWANSSGEAVELIGRNSQRCYKDSPAMKASQLSRNRSAIVGGPCAGTDGAVRPPVEDVWLGHALSQAAIGSTTFIDLAVDLFSMSPWGFVVRESQILWHSNLNMEYPIRASIVQAWADNGTRKSHCSSWSNLTLKCVRHPKIEAHPPSARRKSVQSSKEKLGEHTCAGQPLRKCVINAPKECSTSKVDLWEARRVFGQLARQNKNGSGAPGRAVRAEIKQLRVGTRPTIVL